MNILVLTYWSYKEALIQTYTLPYVRIINKYLPAGSKIYLQTLEKPQFKLSDEELRIANDELKKDNIYLLPYSYSRFGIKAFLRWISYLFQLLFLIITKKIDYLHCWCTPAGAIGYILSILTCKPMIIDSYEPHAEAMVENGEWKRTGLAFKILFCLEKLQSKRAKAVVAATEGFKNWAILKYKVKFKRYYVKPSCVDFNKFSFQYSKDENLVKELNLQNKIVCVYAGKIGGIYLKQEIFDFFKVASDYWQDKFRVLLLTDASIDEVDNYIKKAEIPDEIVYRKFIDHKEIQKYLGLADFALNPVKPVPTKRFCTSIKDGEYWAMGLPIAITQNISDDSEIIEKHKIGSVIKSLNYDGYLSSIKEMEALLNSDIHALKDKIRKIAEEKRNIEIAEDIYKDIYSPSL